jgi:hypothetical protein
MKLAVKEIRCAFQGRQDPPALFLTCQKQIVMDRIVLLRQRNIVAVGKIFNCISERKVLMSHYKTEDIAPGPAPETVVELVFRIHMERRGLFLVERAKPDVTIARAAQMDRSAYYVYNVHRLLYESGNSGISHLASLP